MNLPLEIGFWFWALVVGTNVGIIASVDDDRDGWATFLVVSTLAVLQFFFGVPVLGWILANPQWLLAAAGAYLATGAAWSVARWWFHVRKMRRKYDEFRKKFVINNQLATWASDTPVPNELKQKFWNEARYDDNIEFRPRVTDHKAQIYVWLAFWPWSLAWTIINDPVRRACEEVYDMIKSTLQRISDRVWAGTESDLPQ